MINEYINNREYGEALKLLTDMEDENVRLQRLVCLIGLADYQQALKEVMLAKVKAEQSYYEVVGMYLTILKELERYDEAIDMVIEELSMPYVPSNYEMMYNEVYDQLLIAKHESNIDYNNLTFNLEDIESILSGRNTNQEVIYLAINQMQSLNIRRLVPYIHSFLKNPEIPNFAKSQVIEMMIEQVIDEEFLVVKGFEEEYINPSLMTSVLDQPEIGSLVDLLSENLEDENPTLYEQALQFLTVYLYDIFPRIVNDYEVNSLAGAIHFYLAALQDIKMEIEDIEISYYGNEDDIQEYLENFRAIQY